MVYQKSKRAFIKIYLYDFQLLFEVRMRACELKKKDTHQI
jgi:hypothetical protein